MAGSNVRRKRLRCFNPKRQRQAGHLSEGRTGVGRAIGRTRDPHKALIVWRADDRCTMPAFSSFAQD